MRLFAAARLRPSGRAMKRASAERRASKSSSERGSCRQHRIEQLRTHAALRDALQILCTQSLEQKIVDLHGADRGTHARVGQRLQRGGMLEQRHEVELEPMLEHDAQKTDRGTAQSEWIARAAGFVPERENAGQRVELVGQSTASPSIEPGSASPAPRGR